tara:strand:- start:4602 stop:5039 length:438 start_codon:yes stop_codon:yes gene_type:complete
MELYSILSDTQSLEDLQHRLQDQNVIQKSLNILKTKCKNSNFHNEVYAKIFLSSFLFVIVPDEYFQNIYFANLAADLIINTNDYNLENYSKKFEEYKNEQIELLEKEYSTQYINLRSLRTTYDFLKCGIDLQTNLTQIAHNYFNK